MRIFPDNGNTSLLSEVSLITAIIQFYIQHQDMGSQRYYQFLIFFGLIAALCLFSLVITFNLTAGWPVSVNDRNRGETKSDNQSVANVKTGTFSWTYSWYYDGKMQQISLEIPIALYDFYRGSNHYGGKDYTNFVFSREDRQYLQKIVDYLQEPENHQESDEYDTIMNTISFIQSLPYSPDIITTGYDDYPRYPVETLVDKGGDCEDTAILAAAMLDQMGYDTIFLVFPSHVAIGVQVPFAISGTYYEYQGNRYYYLETTGEGYQLGNVPDLYKNKSAVIIPLTRQPRLKIKVSINLYGYEGDKAWYDVYCDIQNVGTEPAVNPSLNIAALAITKGNGFIWAPDQTIPLDNISPGISAIFPSGRVKIPRGELSQVRCILNGDNFDTIVVYSDQFQA